MSSGRRKFTVRHPVVVDIGCGCRKPKLSTLFSSIPKPTTHNKTPSVPFSPSFTNTTSHGDTSLTATTSSSYYEDTSSPSQSCSAVESPRRRRKGRKHGVVEESEAVVKESSDPYLDFRDSMLNMIVEKEIYAWDDLRDLLHRFLALNSPYHHHLILRAFAEIWNALLLPPTPATATSASASASRRPSRRTPRRIG